MSKLEVVVFSILLSCYLLGIYQYLRVSVGPFNNPSSNNITKKRWVFSIAKYAICIPFQVVLAIIEKVARHIIEYRCDVVMNTTEKVLALAAKYSDRSNYKIRKR